MSLFLQNIIPQLTAIGADARLVWHVGGRTAVLVVQRPDHPTVAIKQWSQQRMIDDEGVTQVRR